MDIKTISSEVSVVGQITPANVATIAAAGFRAIICNRPDGEGEDQTDVAAIETAAKAAGLAFAYQPVVSGKLGDEDVKAFGALLQSLPKPVLAYCRTGTRCTTLWSLSQAAKGLPADEIIAAAKAAGYDMSGLAARLAQAVPASGAKAAAGLGADVLIVGGGAAGLATASSLKARKPDLDIAIIEPSQVHYYQPGWTMVGGGIFKAKSTAKTMASLIPRGVRWIKGAVAAFEPDAKAVVLEDGARVTYGQLVVAPGLKLNWDGIEGLSETLGKNGVTSNYRYDLAPYTWELVQGLKKGRALFTQPAMPIKCAGAPQKALYLSGDHWFRNGRNDDVAIDFYNAGGVLFGVKDYVPALMQYIERYKAKVHFQHNLTKIDGPARKAWFTRTDADGNKSVVEADFDMIHVVPPQLSPDFIRVSPLADGGGWVDVDPASLRHKTYPGVYALGDVVNTTNAKTAAAARKQAPIVAHNLLKDRGVIAGQDAVYNGYGSCPLTVERGKIVLAEFGYGGKLLPTFPLWLIDGQKPNRLAWLLKERLLPPLYWKAMLKGREWLAKPDLAA